MISREENNGINPKAGKGRIIHVANIKGGVGKTTIATNLAACLSAHGRTLIIDLDAQGSASIALGIEPNESDYSSYDLFKYQFYETITHVNETLFDKVCRKIGKNVFPANNNMPKDITELSQKISDNLELIPASSGLFKTIEKRNHRKFLQNLKLCRKDYDYIILDTPSMWNDFIKNLYLYSDLNLIPVTLNALSTKSLKNYLRELRILIRRFPTTRIRIVKNEVFGTKSTKTIGKIKTINENRILLSSLCEMVKYSSGQSTLLLPQSIVFDVEIPEASAIQIAQDKGVPLVFEKTNIPVKRTFELLASKVRTVLNNLPVTPQRISVFENPFYNQRILRFLSIAAVFLIVFTSNKLFNESEPAILTVSQLEKTIVKPFIYKFNSDDNLYKLAKFAISKYRATVPSNEQVENYISETINIYNFTRNHGKPEINYLTRNMHGTVLTFYPPSNIVNNNYNDDYPVYNYFSSLVKDEYSYVTGVWCEYGEGGGGNPHKGVDVAAQVGTPIISPIDGISYNRSTVNGGNVIGIKAEDYVIFFCHLKKSYFSDGANVKKGDVIGLVGETGRTTGPHVHVGYGIKFPLRTNVEFGKDYYEITDPKQFFFRQMYKKANS